MKKVPCFIRLHGSTREIHTSVFESISAAKKWLICWDRPYTIVRITPKIALLKHNFAGGQANVYKKGDYVAVVYKNNIAVNITKYTPNFKRHLWSQTYETIQELWDYLEKNHS